MGKDPCLTSRFPAVCLAAYIVSVPGLLVPSAVEAAPRNSEACRAAAPREDVLETVGPRGELVLASGARAVLAGLRWPEDAETAASAAAWLARHRDSRLALTARGESDRWGRSRVDALILDDEPHDLAGGLIGAGLAYADAGEGDALCRPALLALEGAPRAAGHGVWRDAQRDARDGPGLSARAGRFVVAEGRVLSVGERRNRTYLDFVRRGEAGLTVTVSKRTWRRMLEHGLSAAALKGRRVRVRGVVEIGRGPLLDIASADMIELTDEERAPRR